MPALSIELDNTPVATVPCDEYHVVAVHVGSTRIDEQFCNLHVNATRMPDGGESLFLTWADLDFEPGQEVTVRFLDSGTESHPGKTISELFPDEPPVSADDSRPISELLSEIRALPKLRSGYSLQIRTSAAETYDGRTEPHDHQFGFHVLWDWLKPDLARVSLHASSIDAVEAGQAPRELHRCRLKLGESVTLRVDV